MYRRDRADVNRKKNQLQSDDCNVQPTAGMLWLHLYYPRPYSGTGFRRLVVASRDAIDFLEITIAITYFRK